MCRALTGPGLWPGPGGQPLRRGNFRRRVWLPALQAAGLPRIHFHDLRHTGNNLTSWDLGVDGKIVTDRLGHANESVTQQIYTHKSTGHDRDAAEMIARLITGTLEADASD